MRQKLSKGIPNYENLDRTCTVWATTTWKRVYPIALKRAKTPSSLAILSAIGLMTYDNSENLDKPVLPWSLIRTFAVCMYYEFWGIYKQETGSTWTAWLHRHVWVFTINIFVKQPFSLFVCILWQIYALKLCPISCLGQLCKSCSLCLFLTKFETRTCFHTLNGLVTTAFYSRDFQTTLFFGLEFSFWWSQGFVSLTTISYSHCQIGPMCHWQDFNS